MWLCIKPKVRSYFTSSHILFIPQSYTDLSVGVLACFLRSFPYRMTSSTTQRIATTALESVLHEHFHRSSEVMVYSRSLALEEGKCFIDSFEFPQIHHRNCFMLHFLMARSLRPQEHHPWYFQFNNLSLFRDSNFAKCHWHCSFWINLSISLFRWMMSSMVCLLTLWYLNQFSRLDPIIS